VPLKKASALIRILIADDHDAVRRGMRSVLLSRMDIEICAEVANGKDAIEKALNCSRT
jgi:DNA-binding NarL/FixJ family response regulator